MSGFSADWLTLREPADHRARNPALVEALARHLGGRAVRVTDLGCGTGSNLRALAPLVAEFGPARMAFCTDDREPEHIAEDGHINAIVRDAVSYGVAPEDALVMASHHPALWHSLGAHGAIAPSARLSSTSGTTSSGSTSFLMPRPAHSGQAP